MNTKDTKEKRNFTLRLNEDIHDRLEKDAAELGISKNAYISMIIHKAVKKK